jgi:hypothetical protein
MIEIWKDISGYEGFYKVSNMGRVKSLSRIVNNNGGIKVIRETILKTSSKNNWYHYVKLSINNVGKVYRVHRLVAETFIPNPENKRTVNHIDGNKENNLITNLEWNTHSENLQHAYDTGLQVRKKNK